MDHDDSLLARIDERVKAAQSELALLRAEAKDEMELMRKEFQSYVTRHEFTPVKLVAFGIAGLILSAVVAAMVASVLRSPL